MEKRLRSTLKSSAEEFLSSALHLPLRSSKPTLKSLIHSLPPSSLLSSTLPPSLHSSISNSLLSLRDSPHFPPFPSISPPSKRPRTRSKTRSPPSKFSRENHSQSQSSEFDKLQVLAYITSLCLSHPKRTFSGSELLPAVRTLHDGLILFENHPSLSLEVASFCELFWKGNFPGRETLISQSLPFLISRSLTLKKKSDVHRVYSLREAFSLFDWEDESIDDLKSLLIRCVISPVYLKSEEGRKFLGFMLGLSRQLLKEGLEMVKSQVPFGRKSILEAYGEVLFRTWKGLDDELKGEMEDGFLQGLVDGAIYAGTPVFAASIRRVLGGFVGQRVMDGVEKLLFRLAEPVIFRSLQVTNSNVRLNALHLLLDLFPLEDPDATKEAKDSLIDRQFFLLERLLMDECLGIRVVAVEGCCRVLHLFWEVLPSPTITKTLRKVFDEMSHDIANEVRLSTLNGIAYLLGNAQSHEILKVLLPRLGHLILDKVLSNRVALMDLLLLIRDSRTFQFNKVVCLEELLSMLANDHSQVAKKITRLLMPSYLPSKVSIEEACNRCLTLIKRSPMAGARLCEFAALEGAPLKSLTQLVKVLIHSVLSHDKLNADQIEGFLVSSAHLCNSLVNDQHSITTLQEFLSNGKLKFLFAAANTGRARASVLNVVSTVSPTDVAGLVEDCLQLVVNCRGLCENWELQDELRAAHKLLISCNRFDDMFETLTRFLQKAAYRCHVKFGTELPKQSVSDRKRKNTKSSIKMSAKWKHVGKNTSAKFEDDYSIAVGIAWQIRELLASEETRKAVLGSQVLELPFLALKVISEASIKQCVCCEYMDIGPVLAYAALALHVTLESIDVSGSDGYGTEETDGTRPSTSNLEVLDQTLDHLLNCTEKLLEEGDHKFSASEPVLDNKKAQLRGGSDRNGFPCTKEKKMSNKTKMLTAVFKFIADSSAMGLLSHLSLRCLNFASAFVKHFRQPDRDSLQFTDDELKEIVGCLKSSFSYAAKLLNLVLRETNETSSPPAEAFDLANQLLDLIVTIEIYMRSSFAAQFVAAIQPWLPDLILALGSMCLLQHSQVESAYLVALHSMKLHFPIWPSVLAKTELFEIEKESTEDDPQNSVPEEFPVFSRLLGMMISQLKGSSKIRDAVGTIMLGSSLICFERKEYELVLGLVRFVCVKFVGKEDREWSELNTMLSILAEIYPQIEREIEQQSDEDVIERLSIARLLLEPVWLYHLYETGKLSMMEEE